MKRKITITLLIAILTTMMSMFTLATDTLISSAKPNRLISPAPKRVMTNEYEVMPISLDEYDTMLISEDEDISETQISDNTIKVQLDGEYVDFTDAQGNIVNPEIINNRTMVPMRKIFEIFNANINWDNDTRTVVATTEEKEITLTINNDKAKLKNLVTGEEEEITLDSAPVLLNNRTMVPVRFIAESLEKEVGWDADERTVIIIDFDKIAKLLEEKVPVLKELFEIKIEAVDCFKSKSKIEGKITYKDSEEKANNETVNFEGTINLNMNKEKELEMYIDLEFKGKGTIYNSIVEAGFEKIAFAIVMADNKVYVMMKQADEEIWADMGEGIDMSQLAQIQNQPKNASEYVEVLKVAIGDLDSSSYLFIQEMINLLSKIYSEDSLEISGTKDKQTIKYCLDFKEFLKDIMGGLTAEPIDGLDSLDMQIEMIEKLVKGKIDSANLTLDLSFEEPTSKESFDLVFELDIDYTSTNKDFDITLPDVEVIEY